MYEQTSRFLNKEELVAMMENFETFSQKCFAKFMKTCETHLQLLEGLQTSDLEAFVKKFQAKVGELYILEKQAKCKLIRKVHKIALCMNSLVVENFGSKGGHRGGEIVKAQNLMLTRFKIMIMKMETCVVNVLKEKRLGSVEMLYTFLANKPDNVDDLNKQMMLQMLRECANGIFEFTVMQLYKKKQKKNLRYSTSFNIKIPQLNTRSSNNRNFLDYDTVDYSRSAINGNYSSFVDCEGVLLRDTNFYDASFEIVLNFLQVNKLMLSHYIPDLIN